MMTIDDSSPILDKNRKLQVWSTGVGSGGGGGGG